MIFKKEKEVIALIYKYLEKTNECLSTALDTLKIYLEGDVKKAKALAHQVEELESEADRIRHDIRNKLYSGAYLPLIREDIYKLVESIDKVANAAEASCDFFLNQRPEFPSELKKEFRRAAEESFGIVDPLSEAVICFLKGECSSDTVRAGTKQVGLQESKVDELEWDLTKSIFTSSIDFARKIHLKSCLDTIVEVSDRAEDAADQLEVAVLKSM